MDKRFMPYWFDGSAGIGTVLCRLGKLFSNRTYVEIAEQLTDSSFCAFAVCPGQTNGLAGILELVTDMLSLTGKAKYQWYQQEMVSGLTEYAIHQDDGGIAFPGQFCTRISNDFGTGSAGIGMALFRCQNPVLRTFIDFNLPSGKFLIS